MKKALLVILALAAAAALAQSTSSFSVSGSTNLTMTCVDAGLVATSGADLTNAIGYAVVVSADRVDGGVQTLFASGTESCCVYLPVTGGASRTYRWLACPSTFDMAMSSVCVTGARDCASGDYQPLTSEGRVAYVNNGLLVDGGLTATTTITVRRRQTQ